MSNPYQSPQSDKNPQAPQLPVEVRRVAVRPLQRLTEAKQFLGEQYWLFVGICLVGMLLGNTVAIVLMGPMMCGMYLCFLQHEKNPPARFEQLIQGFNYFLEAFLAMLMITVVSLIVVIPFYAVMMCGFFGMMAAGDNPDTVAPFMVIIMGLGYVVFIILIFAISVPFTFVFPLIVDRQMKAFDAIKTSWAGAKANFAGLFGMYLLHGFLSVLAACACYFPVFLLLPLCIGSIWLLYREIYPTDPGKPLPVPKPSV